MRCSGKARDEDQTQCNVGSGHGAALLFGEDCGWRK